MAFTIIRDDLARVQADAIVVPANSRLALSGGTGYAVAKAAGYRRLSRACRRLGGCAVGQAVATPGFDLPAQHIIHAVGPVWQGGSAGEAALLRSAYDNALGLALRLNAQSVALPLLSAGTYGYPVREAFEIAIAAIREFLDHSDLDVLLVLFDKRAVAEGSRWFGDLAEFIDDAYVDERLDFERGSGIRLNIPRVWEDEGEYLAPQAPAPLPEMRAPMASAPKLAPRPGWFSRILSRGDEADSAQIPDRDRMPMEAAPEPVYGHLENYEVLGYADEALELAEPPVQAELAAAPMQAAPAAPPSLNSLLTQMDEPFSTMLMQLIDARGLTDAQVYKRANISRQHFSKMRNPGYRPTKKTVVALAVALELPLADTNELLGRAGFALTHSSKFDIIVEYFISRGDYDIFAINQALFTYDQPLLA